MSIEEKPVASAGSERIAWHPAFLEAVQLELEEFSHCLQFTAEYQLTNEPLRIDVVIIKKSVDIPIEKNIAEIFRKENIVEYKSPDDYISVSDFYMVYGYACIYAALNRVSINDLTLSFVVSRHPRSLFAHLREERGYAVEEKRPGIYIIRGDILPIQIIDSRKLSEDENLWLKDLDNRLDAVEILRVTGEALRQGKGARIKAYLDVITRANKSAFEEALRMNGATQTLDEILEEVGLVAKWEARGEAKGEARGEAKEKYSIAQNMVNMGLPFDTIVAATRLDPETVRALYKL